MQNYNKVVITEYSIIYTLDGKYHRTDGPALIQYCDKQKVFHMQYCLNGKRHRTDGPAYIYYKTDGSVGHQYYYLNGIVFSEENYLKLCKTITK